MKFFRRTTQVVTCGMVLLALGFVAGASAEQGSAKVQAIRGGAAQYTTDGVTWNSLQKGAVLSPGTTVKTDSLGVVDLYLGVNGPLVSLTPATTLALNSLTSDQGAGETVINTELGLTTGRIQGIVRKMSKSSRYEVKTPVGTCGIRGTKYDISATGKVIVEEGLVEVFYTPVGQTAPTRFEVGAGYTFDPTLNNGRGGVVPTPTNIRKELEDEFRNMRTGVATEERVQLWLPSPSWMVPDRPFDPAGNESGKPWVLPPVSNPSTQVSPPPGGNGQ